MRKNLLDRWIEWGEHSRRVNEADERYWQQRREMSVEEKAEHRQQEVRKQNERLRDWEDRETLGIPNVVVLIYGLLAAYILLSILASLAEQ